MSSGVLFVPLLLLCLCLWPFFSNHSLPGHFYTHGHSYIYVQQYPHLSPKKSWMRPSNRPLKSLIDWKIDRRTGGKWQRIWCARALSSTGIALSLMNCILKRQLKPIIICHDGFSIKWSFWVCHSGCYRNLKKKSFITLYKSWNRSDSTFPEVGLCRKPIALSPNMENSFVIFNLLLILSECPLKHKNSSIPNIWSARSYSVCFVDVVARCSQFARFCREGAFITLFTSNFFRLVYASIHRTINEFVNIHLVGLNVEPKSTLGFSVVTFITIQFDCCSCTVSWSKARVHIKYVNDECTRILYLLLGPERDTILNAHMHRRRRWQSQRWYINQKKNINLNEC